MKGWMNHDYAHCADFTEKCPKSCFRAQLIRDLKPGIPVSFMHLKDTSECSLNAKKEKMVQIVIEIPEGAKKAFDNANKDDMYGCFYDYNSVIGKAIKNSKPYEERKTGKWVHLPNVWGVVFCSECNYDLRINDTTYCPNCGAKMEVDE